MRNEELFCLLWEVPERGFRWADSAPEGPPERRDDEAPLEAEQRHLVPVGEWRHVRWRKTRPLEDETALFRTFADLEPTEECILEFANQHGLVTEEPRDFRERGENPTQGTNLADWKERINEMNVAVRLWEAARSHDSEAFRGLLKLDNGLVRLERYPLLAVVERLKVGVGEAPQKLDELEQLVWTAGDLVKRIASHCLVASGVQPGLDDGPSQDVLFLQLVPKNLAGAMWVQFVRWVEGGRDLARCKECGKWFTLALDARRADAMYCGDPCRFKAYRARKKQALELHAKGKKIAEIAEQLGSRPNTVSKWIREAKAQKKVSGGRRRVGPGRR